MSQIRSLAVFLVITVGGGLIIGVNTAPGEWYAALEKPPYNPPNWIFAPVWTALYILIAIAGWRTWRSQKIGRAMKAWYVQLFLNFLWSPLFFTAHRMDIALGIILLLFVAIVIFISLSWQKDRIGSMLFLPYAVWVGFAFVLNASLLYLN